MTAMALDEKTTTVVRFATTTKETKEMQAAARALKAKEVILRAWGTWSNDRGEVVDLTATGMPIKEVRSVWVEASIQGHWIRLRPNNDPHLPESATPKIQVEVTF